MSTIINLLPQPLQLSDGRILGARGTANSVREIAELGANERTYQQHDWISIQEVNTGGFVVPRGIPERFSRGDERIQGNLTVEPIPLPKLTFTTLSETDGNVAYADYAIAPIVDGVELSAFGEQEYDVNGNNGTDVVKIDWTREGYTEFRIYKAKSNGIFHTLGTTRETSFVDDGSIVGTEATPSFQYRNFGKINCGQFETEIGHINALNTELINCNQSFRFMPVVTLSVNPNANGYSNSQGFAQYLVIAAGSNGQCGALFPRNLVSIQNNGKSVVLTLGEPQIPFQNQQYFIYRYGSVSNSKQWVLLANTTALTFTDTGENGDPQTGTYFGYLAQANNSLEKAYLDRVQLGSNVIQRSASNPDFSLDIISLLLTFLPYNQPTSNARLSFFGGNGFLSYYDSVTGNVTLTVSSDKHDFSNKWIQYFDPDTGQEQFSILRTGEIFVKGVQVVGARQTGFATATGTANKGAFNADTATLQQTSQRLKALEDAVRAHGLIGN